jgi:hypothetical protein
VAVATGFPPGDLLGLDEMMLVTLAEVHAEHWTRTEHLLADLVEVIDSGNATLEHSVYGKKGTKRRKPLEVPRPRTPQPVAKKSPREGFRRLMAKQRG